MARLISCYTLATSSRTPTTSVPSPADSPRTRCHQHRPQRLRHPRNPRACVVMRALGPSMATVMTEVQAHCTTGANGAATAPTVACVYSSLHYFRSLRCHPHLLGRCIATPSTHIYAWAHLTPAPSKHRHTAFERSLCVDPFLALEPHTAPTPSPSSTWPPLHMITEAPALPWYSEPILTLANPSPNPDSNQRTGIGSCACTTPANGCLTSDGVDVGERYQQQQDCNPAAHLLIASS